MATLIYNKENIFLTVILLKISFEPMKKWLLA